MTATETKLSESIISLRRELHQHPELSRQEQQTAGRICQALDGLNIPYRAGIAGHGILAELPGKNNKPFIALRADMDALPIHEETGLEFASKNAGVMHACGHDGHMSILMGASQLLAQEQELAYPVRLIFQPAEELGTGAKEMINAGALDDVAMIFGGHLDRHYPTGSIMVTSGAVNASADRFEIRISGSGGHGARPHESTDAIVAGSLMVMALQTIVSREVDPAFPSVISVGEFKAGTAANVIADHAILKGTVRAQHPEVRAQLNNAIGRITRSISELHGAKTDISLLTGPPPLINTPEMAALAHKAAAAVIGEENVVPPRTTNMGGEDFSYYLEEVSGCYVRYGAQIPGKEGYPAHSSKFDIDEAALVVAAEYLANVAKTAMFALENNG